MQSQVKVLFATELYDDLYLGILRDKNPSKLIVIMGAEKQNH